MEKRKFDLNERLINHAAEIIQLAETFPKSIAGNHLANQVIRSGTSPCLQYGEAQAGESRADFLHKMKIAAKELRETNNCLRLIDKLNWCSKERLNPVIKESNELNAIFITCIKTANIKK